jgi:hypothetical protein
MSGTFAIDGLAYQSNVAIFFTLKKLIEGSLVTNVRLEVRKPDQSDKRKHEFTVDIIIQYSSPNGSEFFADIFEVKGGKVVFADLEDISDNIQSCIEELTTVSPNIITQGILIIRNSDEDVENSTDFQFQVLHLHDAIEDDDAEYSLLEERCRTLIGRIMRKLYIQVPEYNRPARILFSLKHLFEHEIKRLAQKIREEDQVLRVETTDISLKKIVEHEESFGQLISDKRDIREPDETYDLFVNLVLGKGTILIDNNVFETPPFDDEGHSNHDQ